MYYFVTKICTTSETASGETHARIFSNKFGKSLAYSYL